MYKWLKWEIEIQGLAQSGLAYTTNVCNETGYQMPENFANEKCTKEQVEMCFKAKDDENWKVQFD